MLIVEFVFMQIANIFEEYSHQQSTDGDLSNYSEINFSHGTMLMFGGNLPSLWKISSSLQKSSQEKSKIFHH